VRARFGPFTVDTDTRQLLRGESELHLSTKAFDLLCGLVEHRPKVMDKTELQSRIWPDTYVVEANLNVLIAEIRRVLDDDARQPRYVRTVHGVGYAFCGTVADAPQPQAPTLPCWLSTAERIYRLSDGETIVGRDPGCQIWLDEPSVSRRHARIVVDGGSRRLWLDDLNSKNGTLRGTSLVSDRVELMDGDVLTFGSVELTLHAWNADTAAETKRISRKRR
jgi:DNA-binding winged helix-turn-helix (wHTH) protein